MSDTTPQIEPVLPSPPSPNRKRLVIVGAVAVIGLLIAGWWFMAGQKSNNSPQSGNKAAKVSVAQQTTPGEAQRYGATVAYDACQLFTLTDLKDSGLALVSEGRYILHTYLPETVPQSEAVPGDTTGHLSSCAWPLARADGTAGTLLQIEVSQPPLGDVTRTIRTQQDEFYTEKGAQVSLTSEAQTSVKLQLGQAQVRLSGLPNRDAAKRVVSKIIDRLAAGPTAPAKFTYPAPFADLPDPCVLLSEDYYHRLFGEHSSRLPQESLAPSSVSGKYKDGAEATQVVSRCLRNRDAVTGLLPGGLVEDAGNELVLSLVTFDSAQSAAKEAEHRLTLADATKSKLTIGERTFLQKGVEFSDPEKMLCFQKDRYLACVGAFVKKRGLSEQTEVERIVQPVALSIAQQLR